MSIICKKYITKSPSQTKKIAEKIAKKILNNFKEKKALIVGLEGELGAGKTTFLKGFARPLKINEKEILSPTFVIIRKFPINFRNFKDFYHVDCFRIKDKKELENLGFFEILKDSQSIVVIEWAEKIREFLPKKSYLIKFKFLDKQTREIVLKYKNGKKS